MGDVTSGHLKKANFDNFHNHNFRITKPNYLLPSELVVAKNHTVLFHNFDDIFNEQIKIWKEHNKRGGRPPQKANCVQEIVINIKPDTKLDDLQIIANYIKKEYGYTPLEIAIHNDEGYVDKEGKPHFNHHAHIDFCTLQDGCQMARMEKYCDKVEYTKKDGTKSWKFQSNKDSKLQDFIAETLGMERGQRGSKAKRLEHEQYRQVAQQKQVLTDQIDDLSQRNDLYEKLLQAYADSFEINSDSAFEMLKEIGNKATELKQLKADKEQQLKQIEVLKKRRGVILKRGTEKYRAQKKKLKNEITELNKTIQSLTADKDDLQSQLETAKGQILSDTQKADFLNKTINDFIEQGQLYTKKQYDNKEVTKTITKTETQTVTVTKDLTDKDKQDLIDQAIATKIQNGELFTKDQYDNKPVNLTQKMIKDYIEDNRQAMRQAGIYTASDYKQLSQLKADLISELKLAKSGELQLTDEQVKSRIKTLMSDLSAKTKKAEDDLTTATNDLATVKSDLETANKTIQSLTNENGVLKQVNTMLQKPPVNPAIKPVVNPKIEQPKPTQSVQPKPAPKTEVVEGKYNPVLDFLENPQNCSRTIEAIGAIGKFNLDDDTTYNRIFEALSQMQIELTITDTNKTISEKLVNKYFETYPLQKKDKTIQLNNKPKTIKL